MVPIQHLLVENNNADMVLAIEALEKDKVSNKISFVRDRKHAREFKNKQAPQCQPGPTDLLLMNINLLHIYGNKMMNYNKHFHQFKTFQVVMITTSIFSEKVMQESYTDYTNCYIPNLFIWISFLNWFKKLKISGTGWYICSKMINHA